MSRIENQLEALINDEEYSETPQSRIEAILQSMIDDTEYDDIAYSRIEDLLLQWKEKGGGGAKVGLLEEEVIIGEFAGVEEETT